jgi:hypothetical protein
LIPDRVSSLISRVGIKGNVATKIYLLSCVYD